jgi:uncharacterized protein YdgA (DUF945 family)
LIHLRLRFGQIHGSAWQDFSHAVQSMEKSKSEKEIRKQDSFGFQILSFGICWKSGKSARRVG